MLLHSNFKNNFHYRDTTFTISDIHLFEELQGIEEIYLTVKKSYSSIIYDLLSQLLLLPIVLISFGLLGHRGCHLQLHLNDKLVSPKGGKKADCNTGLRNDTIPHQDISRDTSTPLNCNNSTANMASKHARKYNVYRSISCQAMFHTHFMFFFLNSAFLFCACGFV